MSKTKTNTSSKKNLSSKKPKVVWNFPYNKTDLTWLLIGVGVCALGFILMATGISDEMSHEGGRWMSFLAVDLAPVVLFIGYAVIIPMALFKFFSRRKDKKQKEVLNNEQ